MQAKKELEEYLNDTLVNKLIESNIPNSCKQLPCILGIDEAGRGPVLGPMCYAIAYYPQQKEEILGKMKFSDSKELSETVREKLFEAIQANPGDRNDGFNDLGYMIKIISPNMISNSMLRRKKYNLNALSHDTAIDLIKNVMARNIKVAHVYIDTVGPAAKYKEKMERFFPGINFTVTEKADSKYAIVSAASVCAKVMRDRIVRNWKYVEGDKLHLEAYELGSGYPADPGTKKFLSDCIDPVFGFPILARFSWSTITKALDSGACKCDWNEPDDDEEDGRQLNKRQSNFRGFFTKQSRLSISEGNSKIDKPVAQKTVTNADKFLNDRMLERNAEWCKG